VVAWGGSGWWKSGSDLGGGGLGRVGEVGKGRAIAFSFKLAVTKELLVSI